MPKTRGSFISVALALAGLVVMLAWARPASAAVIAGQVDDFESGTVLDWQAGSSNPTPPANIAAGGPAGANDNYLQLTSSGTGTAGGKLVAFNQSQWAGDYLAAGVNAVQMQVNNQGNTALTLRLILVDASGPTLTTVADVNVPAGSGWTTATFPLTPANLTGSAFESVMGSVFELNLVHSPTVITTRAGAPNIAAQLGVDNVTAVPEPGTAVGASVGALAVNTLGRKRKRNRSR